MEDLSPAKKHTSHEFNIIYRGLSLTSSRDRFRKPVNFERLFSVP